MPAAERWDCIVIGGGPAGSAAAERVAREGFRVLILEAGAAPGRLTACGGGIRLDQVRELGIEDRADSLIREVRFGFRGGVSKAAISKPFLAAARRSVLDQALAEKAVRAGAELRCRHRVERLLPGTVRGVEVGTPSGTRRYEAGVLVFADGPATLGRRLFIGFDPATQASGVALRYRVRCAEPFPKDRFEFHFDSGRMPWGYFWIFPKKGYLNIGAATLTRLSPRTLDETVRVLAGRAGIRWEKAEVLDRRGGLIPLEIAARWVADGAVAVGDAAGLVNPMTGEGLLYAVRSGACAGETIAKALRRGDVGARRLAEYPRRFFLSESWRLLPMHLAARGARVAGYENIFRWVVRSTLPAQSILEGFDRIWRGLCARGSS